LWENVSAMSDSTLTRELPPFLSKLPPTRDELPSSYDDKMESLNHVLNLTLLMLTLQRYLSGIRDAFIATNMFVYFSPDQVKTHDFRGPDFFVVLDVPPGPRPSWVVWDEDGRGPDIVIEMLSDSTAAIDKGEKLLVYQDRLRVPEYFWFHPLTGEFAGFRKMPDKYEPIPPEADGSLLSQMLDLRLVPWEGTYTGITGRWLRWAKPDGTLLPTADEDALAERRRAEREHDVAEQERQRADELANELARYRARFGELDM
jgi:Uma2 family endonuclease